MKIPLLLILVAVFCLHTEKGYSQNTLVTISKVNAPVREILNEIEGQTDYLFIINSNVDIERKASVQVKNVAVSKVLTDLLKGTDVHYSLEGTHILLSKNKLTQDSSSSQGGKETVITGTVVDSNKESLIGVSILYKGTSIGTITDIEGNFSLKIPDDKGELIFTYVSYKTLTVPIANKTVFSIVMAEDTKMLEEVVVTALGIERKASSLTYATQQISGKEVTRAKDANFINSMQGKTSGLIITPNSTGAGGSSNILLRGNASILGTNQPLIILDGVPMTNKNESQIGMDLLAGGNKTDGGDALSNINPDDIASINVLKGANAAALYGSSAGNGVIIINTKQGSEGKVTIDVSSSSLFETPLITPKFQNSYGALLENYEDGSIDPNNPVSKRRLQAQSWGFPVGSLSSQALSEIPYATNTAQDNVNNFLQTGTNFNNSIAVSSGTKVSRTYFSYGFTEAQGMIPNNEFYRHNATFRQSVNLFKDRLKLNFSGSYTLQKVKNRPGSGFYANSLYSLYTMPRNSDIGYFEDNSEVYGTLYYNEAINNVYKSTGVQGPIQQWPWIGGSDDSNSPYWYMNRLTKLQHRERLFATIGAEVKIMEGLTAQVRFKVDRTDDTNETKTWKGTKAKSIYNSIYEYAIYEDNQIFADALVSYNKNFGDFSFSSNVGGSTQKNNYLNLDIVYWMGDSTAIPNDFSFSNIKGNALASQGPGIVKLPNENWENALYATAQTGYKDMAYLEATIRNDWARSFTQFKGQPGYKPYFTYYSAGGNVFLDQVFKINSSKLNQLKLRMSYSEVGIPLPNFRFDLSGRNYGSGSASAGNYRSFDNPGPERVHSIELGLDGRFFNRTVDMDITLYNALIKNQYLPMAGATGGMIPLNTGVIRNRGIEVTLGYLFAPTTNFSWKTNLNFSYNVNVILETYGENKDEVKIVDPIFQGGLRIKYEVGKPYGELYGKTFKRKADGTIQTDRKGAPVLTTDYNYYLGNANSPTHLSWGNNFNYKDFSLFFLVDGKIGGKVISYTEARMDMFGVSERTGDARNSGVKYMKKISLGGESVIEYVPGVVMPDGNIAPAEEYYKKIGGGEPALSEYTYDATNFRLREASIGYTFNSLFGNGKNLSVSLVGRNLFFFYKKSPVDPDVSVSTANSFGGIEAFSLPTTRSYGLNLKMSF